MAQQQCVETSMCVCKECLSCSRALSLPQPALLAFAETEVRKEGKGSVRTLSPAALVFCLTGGILSSLVWNRIPWSREGYKHKGHRLRIKVKLLPFLGNILEEQKTYACWAKKIFCALLPSCL